MRPHIPLTTAENELRYVGKAGEPAAPRPRTVRHVRAMEKVEQLWAAVPGTWQGIVIATAGASAATFVGWLTFDNPAATPAHLAVIARILVIATLIGAGLYARTNQSQKRIAALLIGTGFLSAVWLLNGSSDRVLFSVGELCSVAVAQPLFAYLLLSVPRGHLRSQLDRRLLTRVAAVLATGWILGLVMTGQPVVETPLLQCAPHCPRSVFALGSDAGAAIVVRPVVMLALLALYCGTPWLLSRRLRSGSDRVRRSVAPVRFLAAGSAALALAYAACIAAGLTAATAFAGVYLALAVATPLVILVSLARERLLMGDALTDFVGELSRRPDADPEALMASVLGDPSLRIAYRRSGSHVFMDSAGGAVCESPETRAVTWVNRGRHPVAAVMYDPDLISEERFVNAAGAAALMRLEKAQLKAELKSSIAEVAASRARITGVAREERRRIERDLHDGVQQQLVGLRIKLELAVETTERDAAEGRQAFAALGTQMDDVLKELRLLARGIYPTLLHERGLSEALKSATRAVPSSVWFRILTQSRYPEDVEVAVYFCCVEALQNIVKHAGPNAAASLTVWEDQQQLWFQVRDEGSGFDPKQTRSGAGLTNMRDRVEAAGGTLELTTCKGRGTSVRGRVPVA